MQSFHRFALSILLILLSPIIYAQSNPQSAGQVIVTSGPFQAQAVDGKIRDLQRGTYFYSGETLITGTNSTAQVKFSDGTVMAFYPNTRVKVDEYVYKKDPKTDKSVVTLVQGGFRALTGLISKANPSAYKAQTPVAVIGVRGTNYGAVLQKGELYAGVWKGGISIKNDAGLINLGADQDYNFAQVSSKNAAPVGLLNAPSQLIGQCGIE